MHQKELEKVLDYIEANLNQPLSLQEISAKEYRSTMQIYRDFYSLTGHSVKEYIRKRRLSNALAMVKHSEQSLADIAYEYGYSSQQAFCKSVKASTGLTPLEYKADEGFYYYPRFHLDHKFLVTVSTDHIPKTIQIKYYHSQIRGIENRSIRYLRSILPEYKGRIFGRNGKQKDYKFCYELRIEYQDSLLPILKSSERKEIEIHDSEVNSYAKISIKNKDNDINEAWDYLYLRWLKASMFEQARSPYFEEYVYKKDKIKKLILYLPITKRKDYARITIRDCEDMFFLVSSYEGIDGEEKASKNVMEYLAKYNPFYIKKATKFYVSIYKDNYTCGIEVDKDFMYQNNDKVVCISRIGGRYAVLERECSGDSSIYEAMLNAWVEENGLHIEENNRFTLYESLDSKNEKLKTTVYQKLMK